MKKIKCIENNGYRITVGNEYNLLDESQDFYFITNDNGKLVKYSKSLFESIENEIVQEIFQVVERTEQDMINSIDEENGVVYYYNKENNKVTLSYIFDEDSEESLDMSCGIGAISGLNDVIDDISDNIPDDDDYIDLRKALLRKILEVNFKSNNYRDDNRAMWLLSTALNNISEEMISVLDEVADMVTEPKLNPNSGNMIKMWIFYTN